MHCYMHKRDREGAREVGAYLIYSAWPNEFVSLCGRHSSSDGVGLDISPSVALEMRRRAQLHSEAGRLK